ncbi:MAG: HD domain-containing protein [Nitrospirota bacterium]
MRRSEAPLRKNNSRGQGARLGTLRKDPKARAFIEAADHYLEAIGYTEHGFRHADIVSRIASRILEELGYSAHEAELAAVAGFLHDVGNMAGRRQHHTHGALLAREIMEDMGYPFADIGRVMTAIVMHEEDEGVLRPDPVAAALLIGDKSDVHRSRVRTTSMLKDDIHDRVNYAATESELTVRAEPRLIDLSVTIDTRISHAMEYFEIFLTRMSACRKAARALSAEFQLHINGHRMA